MSFIVKRFELYGFSAIQNRLNYYLKCSPMIVTIQFGAILVLCNFKAIGGGVGIYRRSNKVLLGMGQGSKFVVAMVANATMFSHLLLGCSCGSKYLLLP